MFKAIRIVTLLLLLVFVAASTWLRAERSTDWNNSLWVKVYPINADSSPGVSRHIERLKVSDFEPIEEFITREVGRYGQSIDRPVRVELGRQVFKQPPSIDGTSNMFEVMLWSLKLRWWADDIGDRQDRITPDVRIFVRYHEPQGTVTLENSVGLKKGMIGIVNGYAGRKYRGTNNVIIAHEFLHTLGASDKYSPIDGHPIAPHGLAEPDRQPLYPQKRAEIMGGRIAKAADDSIIPKSLKFAVIGKLTAEEIRLAK
jgi:hypothetical protein